MRRGAAQIAGGSPDRLTAWRLKQKQPPAPPMTLGNMRECPQNAPAGICGRLRGVR